MTVPLGEVIRPAGRRAGTETDCPVYSVTKHAGFVPSLDYFKKQVFSRELSNYKLVEAGDFAYATIHLDEGSIGIAPERALISPMYTAFRIDETRVDPRYLLNFLRSRTALARYANLGKGTAHRRRSITLPALSAFPVPLPPLDEQRRVVEILDQVEKLREIRARSIANLDLLATSLFLDMFGTEARRAVSPRGDLRSSQGWNWLLLTDVAKLATGHTPDRKVPEYWGGTIPWVSLPDIRRLDGAVAEWTDLTVTPAGIANSSAVILPAGTVCFSRTASIGFVTKLGRHMATSQDFHNWIPGADLNADYLMTALRVSRPHLLTTSEGSTHKTIYQRVASTFRVLLPPRELQDLFATRLVKVSVERRRHLAAQVNEDALYEACALGAFSGKL